MGILKKIAINYLQWDLRKQNIDNLELVIRNDGSTHYKRNKEKELFVKETFNKTDKITKEMPKNINNLKPCPFCGNSYLKIEKMWYDNYYHICCHKCHVSSEPIQATITKPVKEVEEELIKLWNKRVDND